MIIGLPKEIKDNESRVGLTPAGVKPTRDSLSLISLGSPIIIMNLDIKLGQDLQD